MPRSSCVMLKDVLAQESSSLQAVVKKTTFHVTDLVVQEDLGFRDTCPLLTVQVMTY